MDSVDASWKHGWIQLMPAGSMNGFSCHQLGALVDSVDASWKHGWIQLMPAGSMDGFS
jgi:phage I-like protein